jgi:glycosyltransferase involved in cell wall biosynthesis
MSVGKTKILRVIARLNVGGPALHCLLLSESLTAQGFDTTLVYGSTLKEEASFPDLFDVKPSGFRWVKLSRMNRVSGPIADLKTLWDLIRLIRKERPEIVHTHTAKAGVLGRIAATVTRVPIVIHTFHGHVLSGYFGPRLSKAIQFVERSLARKSTALITLSEGLKEELSGKFKVAPKDRFRVIPLGRDLDKLFRASELRGQLRKELKLENPSTKIIGTVGRLTGIKNQKMLIEACAQLASEIDWRLLFVGEGELTDDLKRIADDLGCRERVIFLGWRSDLARLYADIDVFVLSSNNEGTPLALIEAFAAGCASVSTAVGGVPDMFRKSTLPGVSFDGVQWRAEGALVPREGTLPLRDALQHLLLHEELRRNCGAAATEAAHRYTSHRLSDAMASLYRELLEARTP